MIPILATTFSYAGNGLGGLPSAISCTVTHEVNGIYEMDMEYPVSGQHYDELETGRLIFCTPDNQTSAQAFRIYRITKPLNGIVKVYCQHISYDMSGQICSPFTAVGIQNALSAAMSACQPATSFTLVSPRTTASTMKIETPRELWRVLGGQAGSFLDTYGGEWDFDNMTATLRTRLGQDRGVEIRYGKNMTQFEQDFAVESTYAGVYPYWYSEETGTLVTLPEYYVSSGTTLSDRILLLDCSGDFEDAPTEAQLRTRATNYVTNNKVGDAKITWKVNMALLGQSAGLKDLAILETVGLGDDVKVIYPEMGVNASARVVKVEWDVLGDKYKSVTIGRVKQNLAKIVVDEQRSSDAKITAVKSALEKAIDSATDFITNGAGYMRFIYDSNDELTEIVSLDNPDINSASSVWRWNNGGFGHSSTGYAGPYTLAITQNGAIVADFITSGTLTANVIKAGVLSDVANKNSWDLTSGAFTITNGSINITTNSATDDKIILSYGSYQSALSASRLVISYNSSDSAILTGNNLRLGGSIGNGSLSLFNTSDNQRITLSVSFDALMFYDNGGTLTASYASDGAYFWSSGTRTAFYPADASTFFTENSLRLVNMVSNSTSAYSTTGTATYTLVNDAVYLVTFARRNSSNTDYNGVWLVSTQSASNIMAIKAPTNSGTSASISGTTLTVTRGTAYGRVTITRLS